MQDENNIFDDADNLKTDIEAATNQVLAELGLNHVSVNAVAPQQDSDRYTVGLAEQTAPQTTRYHSFEVDPIEALEAVNGGPITDEDLRPFIRREVLKIFRMQATQD